MVCHTRFETVTIAFDPCSSRTSRDSDSPQPPLFPRVQPRAWCLPRKSHRSTLLVSEFLLSAYSRTGVFGTNAASAQHPFFCPREVRSDLYTTSGTKLLWGRGEQLSSAPRAGGTPRNSSAGGGRRRCPRLGATHGSRDPRQGGQPRRRQWATAGQDVRESWQARRGAGKRGTVSRRQRRPCLGTSTGGMQTGTGVGPGPGRVSLHGARGQGVLREGGEGAGCGEESGSRLRCI